MIKKGQKTENNTNSIIDNSLKERIAKDKSFQILNQSINKLKEKYALDYKEIFNLIQEIQVQKEITIPLSIFEANLSPLESVCKYLKEEFNLNYTKIALLLNRNNRTIWTTYNNAAIKIKEKLPAKESKFYIPISVFKNRNLSVLESLVSYLKDDLNLRYRDIAILLRRDERNIWTVYNRSKKKKNGQ